jgi:hypothetical protein
MRNGFLGFALLSVLLTLAACGAGGEKGAGKVALPRQGLIRVANVMPDAGRMTSFLSSSVFSANQYGEATSLAPELVGQYVMNILLSPPSNVSTTLVSNEPVNLTDQDEFSFIMIGTTASPQLARIDNVDIAFGVDASNPAPPPDFQIVHGATGAPADVDVYVTDAAVPDADLATTPPTAPAVSFGDVTALMQQDPALTYRVRVTRSPYDGTVLFDSGAFSVTRMKRSIYLLLDNFSPSGETLRVANVTALAAENFANQTLVTSMRASNMIPDAPSIDVYLGDTSGTPVFQTVAYGTTTAYSPISNGAVTVNVTPAGVPGTVIATGPLTIVGGRGLSLYASGLDSNDTAKFAAIVESLRSITGQAQLRLVDTAPSAGAIDVYLVTPGQPISDTAPILAGASLLSSASVNLTAPGTYDVFVTRSGTTVELLGPDRISVDAGNVYSAVLLDAPGGGGPLALRVTQECSPLPASLFCSPPP